MVAGSGIKAKLAKTGLLSKTILLAPLLSKLEVSNEIGSFNPAV